MAKQDVKIPASFLKKFKPSDDTRPTTAGNVKVKPRQRFMDAINGQIELFDRPELQLPSAETGRQRKPHIWWFKSKSGDYKVTPKYGPHTVELVAGKPALHAGDFGAVRQVLAELLDMTEKGTLDPILDALAEKTGRHLRYGKKSAE